MKLLEYQGKTVFAAAGLSVPASRVLQIEDAPQGAALREAVENAAAELSKTPTRLVVKAQLDMGGRGKAGLIRVCNDPAGAGVVALEILKRGYSVPALLIEQAVDFVSELYLSISVEAGTARFVVLASAEGGVEIEELARTRPEAIKRLLIDPFVGLQPHQARGLAYDLGLPDNLIRPFAGVVTTLYGLFRTKDAELAEINPLFVTRDGALVAGDSKLIIDDNSLDRQSEFGLTREQFDSDTAYQAALEGIPYVQFEGDISLMCAGAGLTTVVYDLVNFEGGSVANYLEFGGPNYRKAQRAMELCLQNKSAVILIVTFGTIARADVMAQGVVDAIQVLKPDRPIVACIRGTNEDEAHAILRQAGIEPLTDTEEAVRRAVRIAQEKRNNGGQR